MPNNPVQQTDIAKQYDFNGDYVRAILIAVLEGYDDRIHFGERQTPEKIPRIRAFLDELNRFRSIFGQLFLSARIIKAGYSVSVLGMMPILTRNII